MVLTTALEYFTSWMMEAIFHMRWWDYSTASTTNGRICLTNCIFGLGCAAVPCGEPPVLRWLMGRSTPCLWRPLSGLYIMD